MVMAKPDINIQQRHALDADRIWSFLLEVSSFARTHPRPKNHLRAVISPNDIQLSADSAASLSSDRTEWIILMPTGSSPHDGLAVSQWDDLYQVTHNETAEKLDADSMIREYLPYALLPWKAASLNRAVTVAHFAQSLDGKIATHTGHSRWIGNHENLLHAHRMRALCEGILIGKGTLTSDEPALTVRHVPGQNPQRIILSSSPCNFDSLLKSSDEEIWWIGGMEHDSEKVRCLEWNSKEHANPCEKLLQYLYQEGISTVFIEGGSRTTSAFLKESVIDIMQFHISPMVFGSGIPGIALPEIEEVGQSISFESWKFLPVGDSMMFVGNPSPYGS